MNRDSCIVCGSTDFKVIYEQKEYPLCISSSVVPYESDKLGNLIFIGCLQCGCVQLEELVDPRVLYSITHNNTYETPTWSAHHQEFSKFILENTDQQAFVEIGGATGYLAKLIQDVRQCSNYTILDLADPPELNDRVYYIQGNCEETDFRRFYQEAPVILSHVFEHLYNPRKFIHRLKESSTKTIFLSVPNMKVCLEKKFLSFLHVEHTYYCEESHIIRMFYEGGYACKSKMLFKDHSVFFWFERGIGEEIPGYADASRLLESFSSYYKKRDMLYKNIHLAHPTYIVPAGHYGQLVYFYLRHQKEKIIGFLDNDKTKIAKRMYGTDKYVYKVTDIESQKENTITILLNAGPYNKELKEQLKCYHNNIEFIDPTEV